MNSESSPRPRRQWEGSTALRSGLLFFNFFLILLSYYLVKPASRSLFLEHSNADALPWVWTGSGLLLLVTVPFYQRLLHRFGRIRVVLGSSMFTAAALLIFRALFRDAEAATAIGFYVLVDIFSVVLVEQFWSLTNSVYDTRQGKRWYGLIASGGLVGGMAGGFAASWLVKHGGLSTEDLIVVAAGLVMFMAVVTRQFARAGLYREREGIVRDRRPEPIDFMEVWESVTTSKFLALVALLLLASQVAEPIVEYQFMHHVQETYTDGEARTVFLSNFLTLLSGVALGVNLLITPFVHRHGGVIAGLLVQPVLLGFSALFYAFNTSLQSASAMKLADRSLSYSINRASRELLYVGADAASIFRVKAWIDMVGYRVFKIVGNVLILLVERFLSWHAGHYALALGVIALCLAWGLGAWALRGLRNGPPRGPSAHRGEDSLEASPGAAA